MRPAQGAPRRAHLPAYAMAEALLRMTADRPDTSWIPMAWAFPRWFIHPRAALIEAACGLWEDIADLPGNDEEEDIA